MTIEEAIKELEKEYENAKKMDGYRILWRMHFTKCGRLQIDNI